MKMPYLLRRCIKQFLFGISSVSTAFIPLILIVVAVAASPVWAKDKAKLSTIVPIDLGDGGQIEDAWVGGPKDLVIDAEGNLYFPDLTFSEVRQVTPSGQVNRIAGTGVQGFNGDGLKANKAQLSWPFSLAIDPDGNLFISDFGNNRVRFVNRTKHTVTIFGGIQVKSDEIVTVAGNGTFGYTGDGGPATAATLGIPRGLELHADVPGQTLNLYISDIDNHAIRRVDGQTGIITTVAGTGFFAGQIDAPDGGDPRDDFGDGRPPTQAAVSAPTGIRFDPFGNLFILEHDGRVRKVKDGIISTIAGAEGPDLDFGCDDNGPAHSASFALNPHAPTFDEAGNFYLADADNHCVRRFESIQGEVTEDSLVTTVVGNGFFDATGGAYYSVGDNGRHPKYASVNEPTGLAFYADRLYIVQESGVIRFVEVGGEQIFDIGALGGLKRIFGIAADGSNVFATEVEAGRIRAADRKGHLTTLAGTAVQAFSIDGPGGDPRDDLADGVPAGNAVLGQPLRPALDPAGNLYFSDWYSILGVEGSVRKIQAIGGVIGPDSPIVTVVEHSPGFLPIGIAVKDENLQYVAVAGHENGGGQIREIKNGILTNTPIAGTGDFGHSGDGGPAQEAAIGIIFGLAVDETNENLYFGELSFGLGDGSVRRVHLPTGVITTPFEGLFNFLDPTDLVVVDNNLYVVDQAFSVVVRIDLIALSGTIVAGGFFDFPLAFNGDGIATEVKLHDPVSLAVDPDGVLYIGEQRGQRIRRLEVEKK